MPVPEAAAQPFDARAKWQVMLPGTSADIAPITQSGLFEKGTVTGASADDVKKQVRFSLSSEDAYVMFLKNFRLEKGNALGPDIQSGRAKRGYSFDYDRIKNRKMEMLLTENDVANALTFTQSALELRKTTGKITFQYPPAWPLETQTLMDMFGIYNVSLPETSPREWTDAQTKAIYDEVDRHLRRGLEVACWDGDGNSLTTADQYCLPKSDVAKGNPGYETLSKKYAAELAALESERAKRAKASEEHGVETSVEKSKTSTKAKSAVRPVKIPLDDCRALQREADGRLNLLIPLEAEPALRDVFEVSAKEMCIDAAPSGTTGHILRFSPSMDRVRDVIDILDRALARVQAQRAREDALPTPEPDATALSSPHYEKIDLSPQEERLADFSIALPEIPMTPVPAPTDEPSEEELNKKPLIELTTDLLLLLPEGELEKVKSELEKFKAQVESTKVSQSENSVSLLFYLIPTVLLVMGGVLFKATRTGAKVHALGDALTEEAKERLQAQQGNYLDRYTRNITEEVRQGRITKKPTGSDEIITQARVVLGKRKSANVLLVGPAGAGKTTTAEGIAFDYYQTDPNDVEVRELDLTALLAGTQYRGMFEARLKGTLQEVMRSARQGNAKAQRQLRQAVTDVLASAGHGDALANQFQSDVVALVQNVQREAAGRGKLVILFIDEFHTIVGAGNSEGALDASNILKPPLANGTLRVIAATTPDEVKIILKDPALARRFDIVYLNPPNRRETLAILRDNHADYGAYHGGVAYSDEVLKKIVDVSWNNPAKGQPAAALDLMDRIGSYVKDQVRRQGRTLRDITLEDVTQVAGLKGQDKRIREALGRLAALESEKAWLLGSHKERPSGDQWIDPLKEDRYTEGYETALTFDTDNSGRLRVAYMTADGTSVQEDVDSSLGYLARQEQKLTADIEVLRGPGKEIPLSAGMDPIKMPHTGKPKVRDLLEKILVAEKLLEKRRLGAETALAARQVRELDRREYNGIVQTVSECALANTGNPALDLKSGQSPSDYVRQLEDHLASIEKVSALYTDSAKDAPGIRPLLRDIRNAQLEWMARQRAPQRTRYTSSWELTPAQKQETFLQVDAWDLEKSPPQEGLPPEMQITPMPSRPGVESSYIHYLKQLLQRCQDGKAEIESRWEAAYREKAIALITEEGGQRIRPVRPEVRRFLDDRTPLDRRIIPPLVMEEAQEIVNALHENRPPAPQKTTRRQVTSHHQAGASHAELMALFESVWQLPISDATLAEVLGKVDPRLEQFYASKLSPAEKRAQKVHDLLRQCSDTVLQSVYDSFAEHGIRLTEVTPAQLVFRLVCTQAVESKGLVVVRGQDIQRLETKFIREYKERSDTRRREERDSRGREREKRSPGLRRPFSERIEIEGK